MKYFTVVITTIFFMVLIASIFVWFGFRWYEENKVEISKDTLESYGFEVIPPLPKLSITRVSLFDSFKRDITDEDKEYLTPNSNGFIKVTVKNEGGTAKNVTINFRFLAPDDEDAVKYGQPILDKRRRGEKFKEASKDLNFVDSLRKKGKKLEYEIQELKKETKVVFAEIDVGNVKSRFVCVKVELSEQDKESSKFDVRDSEYYALFIYDPP
ncbi:MAG: hypothetical protein OXI63_14205 [Candidatus Poribacteria bacterium]|nr:hypothetical protein [Candidatus Poribacteria bacterium]